MVRAEKVDGTINIQLAGQGFCIQFNKLVDIIFTNA